MQMHTHRAHANAHKRCAHTNANSHCAHIMQIHIMHIQMQIHIMHIQMQIHIMHTQMHTHTHTHPVHTFTHANSKIYCAHHAHTSCTHIMHTQMHTHRAHTYPCQSPCQQWVRGGLCYLLHVVCVLHIYVCLLCTSERRKSRQGGQQINMQ